MIVHAERNQRELNVYNAMLKFVNEHLVDKDGFTVRKIDPSLIFEFDALILDFCHVFERFVRYRDANDALSMTCGILILLFNNCELLRKTGAGPISHEMIANYIRRFLHVTPPAMVEGMANPVNSWKPFHCTVLELRKQLIRVCKVDPGFYEERKAFILKTKLKIFSCGHISTTSRPIRLYEDVLGIIVGECVNPMVQ